MATLILHNNTPREVSPKGDQFTLKEMYEHLSCTIIEMISLSNGLIMICDEESKMVDNWEENINVKATQLYKEGRMSRKGYIQQLKEEGVNVIDPGEDEFFEDSIVGDVLVCNPKELR